MISRTYGDIKAQIAAVCGASGMSVTDPRVLLRTNNAVQELMDCNEYPGVFDTWHIVAESGYLVLPPQFDRLANISIAGVPRQIMSPWAEFVQYGPGPAEDQRTWRRWWCDGRDIFDRGEVVSRIPIPDIDDTDFPGPWKLRVYATVEELPDIYLTAQGTRSGRIIRTQITDGSSVGEWINGERIAITDGSAYVESVEDFDTLTVVTKPQTNGYVRLTAWNGVVEIELSDYAPDETTPSYHKYFSQWLQIRQEDDQCLRVVRARVRKRFVPVKEDTDVMIISNINALKAMVIAQWKRDADNQESAAIYKANAIKILNDEAQGYRGKSRMPAVTFQVGYGIGTLPGIR